MAASRFGSTYKDRLAQRARQFFARRTLDLLVAVNSSVRQQPIAWRHPERPAITQASIYHKAVHGALLAFRNRADNNAENWHAAKFCCQNFWHQLFVTTDKSMSFSVFSEATDDVINTSRRLA